MTDKKFIQCLTDKGLIVVNINSIAIMEPISKNGFTSTKITLNITDEQNKFVSFVEINDNAKFNSMFLELTANPHS